MRARRVLLRIGLIGVLCTAASAHGLCAQTGAPPDSAKNYNEAQRLRDLTTPFMDVRTPGTARKVLDVLLQAEPLYRKSQAVVDVMVVDYLIGTRYLELGHPDSSLRYLYPSRIIAHEVHLPEAELISLIAVGDAFEALPAGDSALSAYRQASVLTHTPGLDTYARQIAMYMADLFHTLAHQDSSLAYYHTALLAPNDSSRPGDVGRVYNGLGNLFKDIGQADSALYYLQRSLEFRRASGDSAMAARALQNIGLVFNNIGQPDSALVYHRQALPMERRAGDRQAEAATLLNIGGVLKQLGLLDSALAYFRLALPIYRETGNLAGEGQDLQNIGTVYQEGGIPDSAVAYFRQAVRVSRSAGDRISEAIGLGNLSLYFLGRDQPDSALASARSALVIDREVGDRANEVSILEHLGNIFRKKGLIDSALAYFELSADQAAVVSKQTGNEFNQLHYNETNGDIYAHWALTWLDRVKLGDTARAIGAALAVTERGRAQALLNLMGTPRELRPGADLPAEGYLLARRALDHAAAALVYSVAGDTLLIWLLLPGGAGMIHTYVDSVPHGRFDLLVTGLRYGVAQEDATPERGGRITRGGSQTLDPFDKHLLTPDLMAYAKADKGLRLRQELAALLLPPELTDLLPASGELLIIPQGGLGLLPFGLLPIGKSDTLLGDRFALRYGPSLTAVAEAEARPGLTAGSDRAKQLAPVLIVGDPAMPAPFTLDREHYSFDPLPSARLEGKAVADSLGASQWLSGAQASEAAVRAAIPDARLIHLATHGLVYSSDAHSRLSFVALAPDATHDGHLSVAKIIDSLTFKAELVVLSACQTAVGNVTSAEGTLGLQRAVLAKGARSVLVSLWNVPDESTLFLIERFYHHWLHDTNSPSKSEALRLAQADVRAEAARTAAHRDWADPFYWAAFQLVGAP